MKKLIITLFTIAILFSGCDNWLNDNKSKVEVSTNQNPIEETTTDTNESNETADDTTNNGESSNQDENLTNTNTTIAKEEETTSPTETQTEENNSNEVSTDEPTTSNITSTPITNEVTKVVGKVVDGPIYGAKIKIVNVKNINIIYASTTTKLDGSYEANAFNLPDEYMVIAEGGLDSSVDGEVNENDEESFTMKAIVKKDINATSGESIANVSPATTVVANIVEDGAMPLEEAEKSVNEALSLDENSSLSKIDATINDKANKAGNLFAFLSDVIPSSDKQAIFKSIAKVVVKKKIKVTITNTGFDIGDLNLTEIADEVKSISPDSISQQEIYKMTNTSTIIKSQLIETIKKVKVVNLISKEEKKEAIAQKFAFTKLLEEIKESDIDSLDEDNLEMISTNINDAIKSVLDSSDLNASSSENIDLISDIVKENLDKSVDEMKTSLIKISNSYRLIIKNITNNSKIKSKVSVKKIVRYVFKHTSLENIDDVNNSLTKDNVLEEIDNSANNIEQTAIVESGEIKDELQNELEDTLGGQIANKIDDNNGTIIETGEINDLTNSSVKNDLFVESVKESVKVKVSIKQKAKVLVKGNYLSKNDKSKLIASTKVIKNVKVNIQVKQFTAVSKSSYNTMFDNLTNSIEESYNQDLEALKEKLKALELMLVDLSSAFNLDDFNEITNTSIKIVQSIKIQSGDSFIQTKQKIKIKIKNDFVKVSVKTVEIIKTIDSSLEDYLVEPEVKKRLYILPIPKIKSTLKFGVLQFYM